MSHTESLKVLLLHAKINYDNMEPLGLLSLGTAVKRQGHTVKVADVFPDDISYAIQLAVRFKPDVIGYGIETPAFVRTQALHHQLRQHLPDTIYCAGGVHTSVCPEQTLTDLGLSFIVKGEAEKVFPEVLNQLAKKADFHSVPGIGYIRNGKPIINPPPPAIQNLDELGIPDRSILDSADFYLQPPGNIRGLVRPKTANLITSRGCPHHCTFCQSGSLMGYKYRKRSVQSVLHEIRYLIHCFGVKNLYFTDDVFFTKKSWLLDFCGQLAVSDINIQWACQCRADSLDEQSVQAMKRAGCIQVDVGVESGDPRILRKLRKGETVEQIKQAATLLHKHKMRMLCSFVIGAPGEEEESIRSTQKLIKKIKPSISQYFTLIPYPGTQLAQEAAEKGIITQSFTYSDRYSQKEWEDAAIMGKLNADTQITEKKRLQSQTFLRDYRYLLFGWFFFPKYLWRFFWLFFHQRFFIKTIVQGFQKRNPLMVIQSIYHAYNKNQLAHSRRLQKSFKPSPYQPSRIETFETVTKSAIPFKSVGP